MDIWRGLKLVKGQFFLFLLASLISFVVILVFPNLAARKLEMYRSSAKILITPSSQDVRVAGEKSTTGSSWFSDEPTLRTLLASQELLESVIDSCGLKVDWTELRTRISLEVLSGGQQVNLLEVSAVGGKPEESRILTQTICDKFVAYVQQLSTAEHDKTVMFLERERRNAEREVTKTQKRMLKLGFLPGDKNGNSPMEEAWVQLQRTRSEQEKDVALAQVELEQLAYLANPDSSGDGTEAPATLMDSNLAKEEIKLEELREVYTDRSPQVVAQLAKVNKFRRIQNARFSSFQSSRRRSIDAKLQKAQKMLSQTSSRMKELEARRPTAEKYMQYSIDERQLNMWQENLLDLTRQLYRARVMQQSSRRDGAFTIVEKPQPGLITTGPKVGKSPVMRVLMAIPAALICGFGILMLVDYLTSTMKMQPRIEDALGLPIIGSIPVLPPEMIANWDSMKGQVRKSKSLT